MTEKATKKKEAKEAKEPKAVKVVEPAPVKSVEELILERQTGKYEIVEKISFWAKHLRAQESLRHLNQTEILELAMSEVLSEKVSIAEIVKKMAEGVPAGKPESGDKADKK